MNYSSQAERKSSQRLTDRLAPPNSSSNTGDSSSTVDLGSQPNLINNREIILLLEKMAGEIKMMPEVAVRAIAVAEDHDAKIEDLAGIISQDLSLATRILSLANSPLFPIHAGGEPISCLKAAVTRLGFRQTRNLILVSCYSSMVSELTFSETRIREQLTRHSFLTGCICSELNRLFKLQMQGEEFTAGLFHDIGRLLLAVTMPEKFQAFEAQNYDDRDGFLEKETTTFGTNHATVGAWFLRRNQVPDMLVSVALHHHQLTDAFKYTRLVALVALADDLANYHAQDPQRTTPYETHETATQLLEMLGVSEAAGTFQSHWEEILDQSVKSCEQVLCN